MSLELELCDVLIVEEVRLLLLHPQYHCNSVGVGVHHAVCVHSMGTCVLLVLVVELLVGVTSELATVRSERPLVILAWLGTVESTSFFSHFLILLI